MLRALGRASKRTSRIESAAIELAAYALLFLQATQRLGELGEYIAAAKRPASEVVHAARGFPTREEALGWARRSRKAIPGTLLTIAGKLHAVARAPGGELLLVRTPSPQELEQS